MNPHDGSPDGTCPGPQSGEIVVSAVSHGQTAP